MKKDQLSQLIILGNGFDLACGLKSSYSDFFNQRFDNLFEKYSINYDDKIKARDELRDITLDEIGKSFIDKDDIFSSLKNWKNYTRWDFIFLFAEAALSDPLVKDTRWQDVESIISDVLTITLNDYKATNEIKNKFGNDEVECGHYEGIEPVSVGNRSCSNPQKILRGGRKKWQSTDLFLNSVIYVSVANNKHTSVSELLSDLKKFEKSFAQYINNGYKLDTNDKYVKNAVDLIKRISRYEQQSDEFDEIVSELHVFSFNYSLDERFKNNLLNNLYTSSCEPMVKSWTNIHGIADYNNPNAKTQIKAKDDYSDLIKDLPAPIFGIDNQGIDESTLEGKLKMLFTKPYRVIENGVNRIRNTPNYKNVDLISIYSHSLGEADYSYFETIFDEVDLYNSDVKLEYFYYPGEEENKRLLKKQESISRIYSLLTFYGRTLNDNHGRSIINRLNLENRLSVIPTDQLPN